MEISDEIYDRYRILCGDIDYYSDYPSSDYETCMSRHEELKEYLKELETFEKFVDEDEYFESYDEYHGKCETMIGLYHTWAQRSVREANQRKLQDKLEEWEDALIPVRSSVGYMTVETSKSAIEDLKRVREEMIKAKEADDSNFFERSEDYKKLLGTVNFYIDRCEHRIVEIKIEEDIKEIDAIAAFFRERSFDADAYAWMSDDQRKDSERMSSYYMYCLRNKGYIAERMSLLETKYGEYKHYKEWAQAKKDGDYATTYTDLIIKTVEHDLSHLGINHQELQDKVAKGEDIEELIREAQEIKETAMEGRAQKLSEADMARIEELKNKVDLSKVPRSEIDRIKSLYKSNNTNLNA